MVFVVGVVVGWFGLALSTAAIVNGIPGSGLYVPLNQLHNFNPLDVHGVQYSSAQLADMVRHNAGTASPTPFWVPILVLGQIIAVSVWDAIILSIGVWIVGFIAILPMKLFAK